MDIDAGETSGLHIGAMCRTERSAQEEIMKNPADIEHFDPKKEGGCVVAFGYDVDMSGSPRPLDEWIGYLKKCLDLAYEGNLFYCQTVHPSTSFKHDPEARYVREVLEYCREKPGVIIATFRDVFQVVVKRKDTVNSRSPRYLPG